jgi:ParB-like chromosome segregation protein Spo0J
MAVKPNKENTVSNASIKRLGLEGISKKDMYGIDPRLLEVEEGLNLRFVLDREHIDGFKATIRAGGTIPPIEVRATAEKRIFVVDGHHRRAAIVELIEEGLDIKAVDCISHRGSDADRVVTMLTSSQGRPLTPLEQAIGYLRLERMGWTKEQIAERVARTVVRVEQLLDLACADAAIHTLIRTGKVSGDLALEMVRKHGDKAIEVLKASVETAEASGKTKVTRAKVVGRAVSKKVVKSVFARLSSTAAMIPTETLKSVAEAKALPEAERAKMTVTVPVEVLIGLMDAGDLIPSAE